MGPVVTSAPAAQVLAPERDADDRARTLVSLVRPWVPKRPEGRRPRVCTGGPPRSRPGSPLWGDRRGVAGRGGTDRYRTGGQARESSWRTGDPGRGPVHQELSSCSPPGPPTPIIRRVGNGSLPAAVRKHSEPSEFSSAEPQNPLRSCSSIRPPFKHLHSSIEKHKVKIAHKDYIPWAARASFRPMLILRLRGDLCVAYSLHNRDMPGA